MGVTEGVFIYRKKYLSTLLFNTNYLQTVNSFYAVRALSDSAFLTPMGRLDIGKQTTITAPFERTNQRSFFQFAADRFIRKSMGQCDCINQQAERIEAPQTLLEKSPDCNFVSTYQENGRLYLGENGKVSEWATNGDRLAFVKWFPLQQNEHPSFLTGWKDKLIYGSGKGIWTIDKTTGLLQLISDEVTRAAYAFTDSAGIVWIGSRGQGWFRFDANGLIAMPVDQKGFLRDVHAIAPDRLGFLWISTNNGLFRYSHKDATAYGSGDHLFYNYFDQQYGGLTSEYNGGGMSPVASTPSGKLAFTSVNGIVLLDPASIPVSQEVGTPELFNILIDGKPSATKQLNLPPEFRELSISVSDPYFGHSYDQQISYRLNGDHGWTVLTVDRRIRYNRLKPGDYELTVRSLAGYGKERYSYTSVRFTVQPHWYQTIWFILACILAGLLIIFLIFAQKIRRIRRQKALIEIEVTERTRDLSEAMEELESTIGYLNDAQEELTKNFEFREQIASSVLHDIRSPLGYLHTAFSNIEHHLPPDEQMLRKEVKDLAGDVKKVADYAQNLLFWINKDELAREKKTTDISALLDNLVHHYSPLAAMQGNRIVKGYAPGVIADLAEGLLIIVLRNLLDNAIKYTSNGVITLSANLQGTALQLAVTDTGVGMSADKANGTVSAENDISFGYRFIRDMLQYMNGTAEIKSEPGKGTTINILLLL